MIFNGYLFFLDKIELASILKLDFFEIYLKHAELKSRFKITSLQ